MGIGGHIHVEVVTEEITFPMGSRHWQEPDVPCQ